MNCESPNAALYQEADGVDAEKGTPCLLGVPYDGTSCFQPGSRFGPDSIRSVSEVLETYSPLLDRDLRGRRFSDLGNLVLPRSGPELVYALIKEAVAELLDLGTIPVLLGGEHGVSPGAVHAALKAYPDLCVVQFDAHADLREEYSGTPLSHASAMRRVLDELPPERLLQVGIRSGLREEFEEMRRNDRLVPADAQLLAGKLKSLGMNDRPCYLTIDLDFFDPAYFPGTGTPEPGGIDWQQFELLFRALPLNQVVAADVVELSPALDPSLRSSILAAKVVRELILSIGTTVGP